MTPKQVQRKMKTLRKKEAELFLKIKHLQDVDCEHVNLFYKHQSNTGNYDPSSDSYWTDFKCEDCGKFWSMDPPFNEFHNTDPKLRHAKFKRMRDYQFE